MTRPKGHEEKIRPEGDYAGPVPEGGPGAASGDFNGAKGALFIGQRLVLQLRDDLPFIDWPGHWDLPGGGREGRETPQECLARETQEELGLDLSGADWIWAETRPSRKVPGQPVWFFVLRLPAGAERQIRFGDEGQGWVLVPPRLYFSFPRIIPHQAAGLRRFLAAPAASFLIHHTFS